MIEEPSQSRVTANEGDGGALLDYSGLRHEIGFVLRAPSRHKNLAVACFLTVLVLAVASQFVLRDVYAVEAHILALRNPVMGNLSNPGVARGQDWDAPTRAARETVLRRDNLVALCEQTKFVDRYLKSRSLLGRLRAGVTSFITGKEPTRAEVADGLAGSLESRLWVRVASEDVTIRFEWTDPDIAFDIVETAVQNFLEARHASEVAVLADTIAILEGRAAKLQLDVDSTLDEMEAKQRARSRAGPRRALSTRRPIVRREEDLARMESTLASRKRALADLESFRQQRLADLHAQLVQQEATYADRHPEVLNTRQRIAALAQPSPQGEALRTEVRELEREVIARGGRSGTVGAAVAPPIPSELLAPSSLLDSEDVRSEYDRGQLRLLFDQYASLLRRIDSAKLELQTAQAAFKYKYSVISPPMYPKGPMKPYLLLRVVGGLIGGFALAVFVTTAVDIRSGRVIEEWQTERHLRLPVLGRFR